MRLPGPERSVTRTPRGLGAAISPEIRRQLLRYGIAGVCVGITYIGLTLLLSGPAGLPIQAAIPIAYSVAIVCHFSLQRWFVFRSPDEFALATHHQVGRYLLIALFQYAFTAIATAVLPNALGLPERLVYVIAAVAMAGLTFLLLRTRVFHAPSE